MFFFIAFDYNLLRAYKDSLVITANHSGSEAIPFIKVWAILPSAILLMFLFTRLTNRFSREKVFYIMISLFLCFFFLFAFVLYPAQETLHPHEIADRVQAYLPLGCKGFIAIFRNWIFTLFYIVSELWSTAILSVLFWGFANEVTPVTQARRFYGLFTIGANLAGIIAGQAAIYLSGKVFFPWLHYGKDAWDQSILFLSLTIIATGFVIMGLYRYLHTQVLPKEKMACCPFPRKQKVKMSMRKNFAYLRKSKYLLCIAVIVLSYNLVMNLVELVWKNQIKLLYPNPIEYNAYMGEIMTWMGVLATFLGVFVTHNLLRRSWFVTALVPAIVTLVTGLAFFFFVVFQNAPAMTKLAAFLGATPLFLSVTLGSMQNVLSRACKYTLFDASKETSFIPLDKESKIKGKAAIDGVGSRLGKSGGSMLHQSFLLFFSTILASAPYIAFVFLLVVTGWISSIFSLDKQFKDLTASTKETDEEKEFETLPT